MFVFLRNRITGTVMVHEDSAQTQVGQIMSDIFAEVHKAIWESSDPYQAQMNLLENLVKAIDPNDIQLVLAISGLSIRCRAENEIQIALSALKNHLSNPWASLMYGKLCNTLNDRQGVLEALDISIDQLKDQSGVPDPVKVDWMRLLAKFEINLFREFGIDFSTHIKDAVLFDFDESESEMSKALMRYSERLSAYVNIELKEALAVVDFAKDMVFCANQHLEWNDASAVNIHWLKEVLQIVTEAKKTRKAFSIVRLGDGEALFLQGLRPTLAGAAGRLQGGDYRELDNDEMMIAKDHLEGAIRDADLCLVPDLRQILYGPPDFWRVWTEIDRIRGFDAGVVGGGWSFGVSLEQHGLSEELVSLVSGVIGPADPEKTVLLSGRGIEWIPIPGEVDRLDKSGSLESHFHSYYPRINSMNFSPGEVWLVAGGILGKSYCNTIKRNGGIAVDIGSIMDVWQGRTDTRGEIRMNPWLVKRHILQNS